MIILQAQCTMTDEEMKKYKKQIEEDSKEIVVIIPNKFRMVNTNE